MVWLSGSSGSVLIDLREKIKNSLTRGKLRNSGRGRNSVRVYIYIYKVERVKRKVSKRFFPVDIEEMSLCAPRALGGWREREKKTNIEQQNVGRTPLCPRRCPPLLPLCV